MTAGDLSGAAQGDVPIVSGSSLTSSGGSLTLALGDGNTIGVTVAINGGNGSMALGSSITFSSSVGTATSLRSVALLMSNAGTAGIMGDLSLSAGTASVGDSDALDIGCEYDSFKYVSVIGILQIGCGLGPAS